MDRSDAEGGKVQFGVHISGTQTVSHIVQMENTWVC